MSLATLVPPIRYVSASANGDAVEPHRAMHRAARRLPLERDHRGDVILQVLPDARQRHLRLDPGGAQRIGIADAESISTCGELMTPPASSTSRWARTLYVVPPR
jgi:hypothetical protein